MKQYDIVVLGGGPGGYVAAIKGAQKGRSVCLIEKGQLGGVCLNQGCIPTKTMLKTAALWQELQHGAELGLRLDVAAASVDMAALQKHKNQVVSRLTGGVGQLLQANGVELIEGQGLFTDAHHIQVNGERIEGQNIIIATGSVPALPPVEIIDGSRLLDSEQALELTEIPPRLAVIGGGVIGVEFASIFAQLGSKVTIIERLESILPMFDADIITGAARLLKKQGIDLHVAASVQSIDGGRIRYEHNGVQQELDADLILMAVGRKPALTGYGLEQTGVAYGRAIQTDAGLRTNLPGVYAIGDVNGKSILAHTASAEGLVAVENICGGQAELDYGKIPACVYLTPEIAAVGLTEAEARAAYPELKVGRFPLSGNGKSLVEGDTGGFIKVLVNGAYDEIVGAHLFAHHATDMIGGIANLMQAEATVADVLRTVYPHPSVSEAIPEAFHAAEGKPIHAL